MTSGESPARLSALSSGYGSARAHVQPAPNARAAMVTVGGVGNDVDGPHGAYARIGEALQEHGHTSVRVSFARPGDLRRGVSDVLGALAWCGEHGLGRAVLLGWSFGGAVVLAAGAGHGGVVGVATLATQAYDASQIAALAPRSLLLVHGTADRVLPASISQSLFRAAQEPKRLVLLDGAGHDIEGREAEFEHLVVAWALPLLCGALADGGPEAG